MNDADKIVDVCWKNPYLTPTEIRIPEQPDLNDRLFLWKTKMLFLKEQGWPNKGPFRKTWWEIEPLEQGLRSQLTGLIPPDEYPRCLSIGCAGREAIMLSEKGYSVTGIDLNPADCWWTRRHGVEAFTMDAQNLTFPNGSFDCAVTSHCFEHTHAPWLAVLEMWAVLKPNALVLFVVPPYKEENWGFNRPDGIHESHSMCLTENQWKSILTRLGFDIVSSRLCGDPLKSGHNAMLLRRQPFEETFENCRSLLTERLAIGTYYEWPEYKDEGWIIQDAEFEQTK